MRVHRYRRAQCGLTPSVERGDFLASREKTLIDDIKWGVEGPFRVLLGKLPIQYPCFHALSPESAFCIRRIDSRQKCGDSLTCRRPLMLTPSTDDRPSHAADRCASGNVVGQYASITRGNFWLLLAGAMQHPPLRRPACLTARSLGDTNFSEPGSRAFAGPERVVAVTRIPARG
jgi:hypothetical protein